MLADSANKPAVLIHYQCDLPTLAVQWAVRYMVFREEEEKTR